MHFLIHQQQQQQQQNGRILLLLLVAHILVSLLSFQRDFIFVEALSAQSRTAQTAQPQQQPQLFTHKGWRIAMNIGREPETNGMVSSDWASSGCRLPVIAQCDFQQQTQSNDNKKKTTTGIVVPLTNDIRYTGPDGEIIKPIQGGEWTLNKNNNDSNSNKNELSFYLNFPEELIRRDVIINAGSILRLDGIMYSTKQLKEMNTNFYQARDQKWDAGEELNNIEKRRTAPLKWNPSQNNWEKQSFPEDTILVRLQKETNLKRAEQKIEDINKERPNPKDISLDCGPFPGIGIDDDGDGDGDVYFRKKGKVFLQSGSDGGRFGLPWSNNKQCVIGTWSAEPINDKPLSYY